MARYYFAVTLWGPDFRRYFLDLCLASLLAPGNVPALTSAGDEARLLVCTTPEDWEEMQKDATFQQAAGLLAPEFLELRMPPMDFLRPYLVEQWRRQGLVVPASEADWKAITIQPSDVIGAASFSELESIAKVIDSPLPPHAEYDMRITFMTWGHKLAAERAFREKCSVIFLGADMMFADGSVRELRRCVVSGHKVILVVTLRFDQDRCLQVLKKANLLVPGKALTIAPRDLVATVFPLMHVETACFEFNSPWFCDHATSSLWRIPGDHGAVVYNLNYFPVLINFAEVTTHDMDARITIDGHYVDRNFNYYTDLHVIDDFDRFLYISFTKQSQYYYAVRKSRLKSSSILGRYYKIYLLRKTLNGLMGNAAKRHTYPIPVIFHSKPLTEECDRLISRTQHIAQLAAAPLGIRDALFRRLERVDLKDTGLAILRRVRRCDWDLVRRGLGRYLGYLGEVQRRLGLTSCALVCFSLALKVWPDDAANWSRSFKARMTLGDFSEALKAVDAGLSLSPNNSYLMTQRAEVAQYLELWDIAMSDYEVMLREQPDRADLRAKAARMYAAWGDRLAREAQPRRALDRYAIALQTAPNDAAILARCANMKIALGDYAAALSDVNSALALAPNEANLIAQQTSLTQALNSCGAGL